MPFAPALQWSSRRPARMLWSPVARNPFPAHRRAPPMITHAQNPTGSRPMPNSAIDTDQLSRSFQAISETFAHTPADVRTTLTAG